MTSDAVTAARAGCWCASYRKPCVYHEGWEDGYEAVADRIEKLEAENERHRASHLVRAVLHGYGDLDEKITDYINTDFDRVPWEVAATVIANNREPGGCP